MFAGQPGVSVNTDGPLLTAGFKSPTYISVAINGDIYVLDPVVCVVKRIRSGTVTTVIGTGACYVSKRVNNPLKKIEKKMLKNKKLIFIRVTAHLPQDFHIL